MAAAPELSRPRQTSIPTPPLTPPPSYTHEATALAELLSSSLLCVPAGGVGVREHNAPVGISTQPDTASSPSAVTGIPEDLISPVEDVPDPNGRESISQGEKLTSRQLEGNTEDEPVGGANATTSATVATSSVPSNTALDSSDVSTQAPRVPIAEVELSVTECDCWDKKFLLGKNTLKKRFYVGKMRFSSCPPHLTAKWESEIHSRLMSDLSAVLSWSTPNEFFEAELRMAGYARNERTVRLKPTVCIRCMSKGTRKDFEKAVKDLDYLNSFSWGNVEVRLGAPRLAASGAPLSYSAICSRPIHSENQREYNTQLDRKLQVEHSTSGASACGLKLRMLADTGSENFENISTIGGLIKVNDKIYGLTTAHGILGLPGVAGNEYTNSSDCSDSESCTSSDFDSDSLDNPDATSGANLMDEHESTDAISWASYTRPIRTAKSKVTGNVEQLEWKSVTFCGPMCFCGRGSLTGGTNHLISSRIDVDFALIDMGLSTTYQLFNTLGNAQTRPEIRIGGLKHDGDLKAGEVILLIRQHQVRAGHLLEGTALFRSKSVVFNTKKIELDAPLPPGMSGTWVVQDSLLCGVIVAAYDGDTYAHMITADKMFQDIREFLPYRFGRPEVSVATEDDIIRICNQSPDAPAHAPKDIAPSFQLFNNSAFGQNATTSEEGRALAAHGGLSGGSNETSGPFRLINGRVLIPATRKNPIGGSNNMIELSDPFITDNPYSKDSSNDSTCNSSTTYTETNPFKRHRVKLWKNTNDESQIYPRSSSRERLHALFRSTDDSDFQPTQDCPMTRSFAKHQFSWSNAVVIFISLCSTALSILFVALALRTTRYRSIENGLIQPATTLILISIGAKAVELSFVASFTAFLGQVLSRRAFDKRKNGVSFGELSMWRWLAQPSTLITRYETVKYAGVTTLGILSLLSAISATLYTPATNALVQPVMKDGKWERESLVSTVQTDFANLAYMTRDCQVLNRSDELRANATCLQLEHVSQALNNYHNYLVHWGETVTVNKGTTNQRKRPPGFALWHGATKATGQWIDIVNTTEASKKHGRVVNNVSLAMPHPSVSRSDLLHSEGEYSLSASVLSLVTRALCVNMLEGELRPLVYSMWGNDAFDETAWEQNLRNGVSNKNDTAVDELYGWTKRGPTLKDYPPVFPKLPMPSQTVLNSRSDGSERDAIYLLAQGGKSNGSDSTGSYVLCQMRVTVSTDCSTRYNATNSAAALEALCEDPTDDMAYIRTHPEATARAVPNWVDVGFDWAESLSLNSGIKDLHAMASDILTRLILKPSNDRGHGVNVDLSGQLPSVAEALAVMSSSTLLGSMQDAPLDTYWDNPNQSLIEPWSQGFVSLTQTPRYVSGGADVVSKIWIVPLLTVCVFNIFVLVYFLRHRYVVTDILDPSNQFALAINSPPNPYLRGSCGAGPEGKMFKLRWSLNTENDHLYLESSGGTGPSDLEDGGSSLARVASLICGCFKADRTQGLRKRKKIECLFEGDDDFPEPQGPYMRPPPDRRSML